MENEIPFALEAEEQARLQVEEDALEPRTEETPLLSRETQNLTAEGAIRSSTDDDQGARLSKPWLGTDWEGRPWWKRPSVSQNTRFFSHLTPFGLSD